MSHWMKYKSNVTTNIKFATETGTLNSKTIENDIYEICRNGKDSKVRLLGYRNYPLIVLSLSP